MIEIKIWGRAGQGVVTAAELLAIAAFHDKKYSQAFPRFGAERRGPPLCAFVRIDDKPINLRSQIYTPNYILVLDDSIQPEKAKEIYVNSTRNIKFSGARTITIDCMKIECPVNTALLAYFIKKTKLISLDSLLKAIDERFPKELAEQNKQVARYYYSL